MKKFSVVFIFALLASIVFSSAIAHAAPNDNACWGQATNVFAQMGYMGEHASQQADPRLGLRNLARALYEAGVITDDTMQALGEFAVSELGLTVEACQ